MSNYIVCEDTGKISGTFSSLDLAQEKAQAFAESYISGDESLSVKNTSTYYACVKTRCVDRDINGICCVSSNQSIVKFWNITNLVSP